MKNSAGVSKHRLLPYNAYYHNWHVKTTCLPIPIRIGVESGLVLKLRLGPWLWLGFWLGLRHPHFTRYYYPHIRIRILLVAAKYRGFSISTLFTLPHLASIHPFNFLSAFFRNLGSLFAKRFAKLCNTFSSTRSNSYTAIFKFRRWIFNTCGMARLRELGRLTRVLDDDDDIYL